MFNFAFDSICEAFIMQIANGQSHGIYVWSVIFIVFLSLAVTFFVYKRKISSIGKKIK
jgi:heme exporter protein D